MRFESSVKFLEGYKLDSQRLAAQRLHTRTIIRDRRQAFVGSQSLRPAELDSRRELGLIIHDPKSVKKLLDSFETDWVPAEPSEKKAFTEEFGNSSIIPL